MKYKQTEENRHVRAVCPKCGEDNNYRDGSDYHMAICSACNHNFKIEHGVGRCARCGSDAVNFGLWYPVDMNGYYEYECDCVKCKHKGKEWYSLTYMESE